MRKGIGITTRNRPHILRSALEHFAFFHSDEDSYVIVDDSSDCWLDNARIVDQFRTRVSSNVSYLLSRQRLGIAKAKNECLIALRGTDHIFLFDDDAFPRCRDWSSRWVAASEASGVQHSMFNTPIDQHMETPFFRVLDTIGSGETAMNNWSNCCGVALHFTNECIEAIGGYDTENAINVYGYEHAQMSQRASAAGMTRQTKYASPALIDEWIYSVDMSYFWQKWEPPLPLPWLDSFRSSVTPDEAARTEDNAAMMRHKTTYFALGQPISKHHDFIANAVIPCKSNFEGLQTLVTQLLNDSGVGRIIVIADGENAHRHISSMGLGVELLSVPTATGLHAMWNLGLEAVEGDGRHIAIINDDVSLSENAISIACSLLDQNQEIGLVSPSQYADDTSIFNQTTGFAGYCMVLAKDLVDLWRFNEEMKWWYGDNDVIMWVHRTMGRQTGITGMCHALGNRSHTITTDPPPNFHSDIQNDARLYREKWGQ